MIEIFYLSVHISVKIQEILKEIPLDDIGINTNPVENTYHEALPSDRTPRLIQNHRKKDLINFLMDYAVQKVMEFILVLSVLY